MIVPALAAFLQLCDILFTILFQMDIQLPWKEDRAQRQICASTAEVFVHECLQLAQTSALQLRVALTFGSPTSSPLPIRSIRSQNWMTTNDISSSTNLSELPSSRAHDDARPLRRGLPR